MSGETEVVFGCIRRSYSEMTALPPEHAAFLGVVEYMVTELNVLQRIYLQADHREIESPIVEEITAIQRNLVMRTISSKLFEFVEFCDGVVRSCKSVTLSNLVRASVERFRSLDETKGFEIARNLRHESANHYSFKAALKNLQFVDEDTNFDIYAGKLEGNTFFPFGERLMFNARMDRHFDSTGFSDTGEYLDHWIAWMLGSASWARLLHKQAFEVLWMEAHPTGKFEEESVRLPEALVVSLDTASLPLFAGRPS